MIWSHTVNIIVHDILGRGKNKGLKKKRNVLSWAETKKSRGDKAVPH